MSRSSIRLLVCSLLVFAFSPFVFAQSPPASDPQALSYASQSIATLSGGVTVSDVTLTGNVTRIAGSETDTGTATLLAKGTTESRVDLQLTGGNRSDILNGSGGFPQGSWIGSDGISNSYAAHNCWTDSSWFFPALSSLVAVSSNPNVVLSYVGQESSNGTAVQHLQSYVYVADQSFFQQISTMDFYLDSTSLFPVTAKFNIHPDNDGSTNIPVEIDFSNYQPVGGVRVPFHIQKLVQGSLVLDVTISSAVFNSGLPDGDFAIQ